MNRAHLDSLRETKRLSNAAHVRLSALLVDDVVDPTGASVALVRLWFKHLPRAAQLGDAIAETAEVIGRQELVVQLANAEVSRCAYLNDRLREWLRITRDRTILEPLTSAWLRLLGRIDADDTEEHEALTVERVANDPMHLVLEMLRYKRQHRIHTSPSAVVDALALERGWWTRNAPLRAEAFVRVALDESIQEDEWVPRHMIATSDTADAAVERLVAKGLVHLLDGGGVSTAPICACSRAVKTRLEEVAATLGEMWHGDVDPRLTAEQSEVARTITGGTRVLLCTAPAGTGKTFTASAVASLCDGDVLCLAPTWKAVGILRGKLAAPHVTFMTVQGFMCTAPPPAKLVIVDEASMLTMGQVRHILDAYVVQPATRLLFLGDDAQLPCIGRGFPIRDVATRATSATLTVCMRTDQSELRDAARCIREGIVVTPGDAVHIVPSADPLPALRTTLFPTRCFAPWDAEYVQFITPQNKHVAILNEEIQAMLLPRAVALGRCRVGGAVRVCENGVEYKNGDEGVLVNVGSATRTGAKRSRRGTGIVLLRDGRQVAVPEDHLTPAYATTVHKVQGSEYSVVALVLFPHTHPSLLSREMVYTSATRATRRLYLVGHIGGIEHFPRLERRTVFDAV